MILKKNFIYENNSNSYSLAIGNFDGIHLGHKYILKKLKKYKKNDKDKIAVLTFNPHPVKVLQPNRWKKNIIKFRAKYRLLKKMDIDVLFQIPFTLSFSNYSARFFIDQILIKNIQAKNILVGEDFRFGKNREGDIGLLKEYADDNKFNLEYFNKKGIKDDIYSSSRIRKFISKGDMIKASLYLGYYWEVEGKVVPGRSKGRELGFPTANLNYSYQISPSNGIYAGWVKLEGESIWRMGAISSGTRPHYKGIKKILEVHLLFFSDNLYKRRLRVAFIEKIRDELVFDNEKSLIDQMQKDCQIIKRVLKKKLIYKDNQGL